MSNKQIITTRLKRYLTEQNFEEVKSTMLAAESFRAAKTLLKRSYLFLGKSAIQNADYYSAIVYLNKARVIDPASKIIFELLVEAFKEFFRINFEEFSKKDLEEYRQAILPIIEFHKLKFPAHREIIDSMSHMFRRIDYRIKYEAKDVDESKITFRVHEIKNAQFDNMTIEEVNQELAKTLTTIIRRELSKDKSDKSKKKKKGDMK